MDGPSYAWGLFGLGGTGTTGDYWLPVLGSAAGIALLTAGWRGARQPFGWLLVVWHGALALGALRFALTSPGDFRFRGDTLGLDIDLAWLGPLLFGGFAVLAVRWLVREGRTGPAAAVPPWSRRNSLFTTALVALLPVQFVLLRFGPPHGATDRVGVVLTIVQWFGLGAAVYPWGERRDRRPAEDGAGPAVR